MDNYHDSLRSILSKTLTGTIGSPGFCIRLYSAEIQINQFLCSDGKGRPARILSVKPVFYNCIPVVWFLDITTNVEVN
jgi:hypothetical protein